MQYKMEIWGAIYALLSRHTTISATAMGNICRLPGAHFGRFNGLAMASMTSDDVDRMAELVAGLTPEDLEAGPVPEVEQGQFWLAYYKAGGSSGSDKPRAGRPRVGGGIDWSDVDWSLQNAEIARKKGCSPETVRARRAKIEEVDGKNN